MRCPSILRKLLIVKAFVAPLRVPIETARPCGGRLIEGFSVKLQRRAPLWAA
jgi:hypothetical protein